MMGDPILVYYAERALAAERAGRIIRAALMPRLLEQLNTPSRVLGRTKARRR